MYGTNNSIDNWKPNFKIPCTTASKIKTPMYKYDTTYTRSLC